MRKALFTNGPVIGTMASAGVGCIALQMNFDSTHARRALTQSVTTSKKLETTFSYDGWQMDAELANKCRTTYLEIESERLSMSGILSIMLRKQQVHNGDRSHPSILKLDALTPTLSYAGWEVDAFKIEWPQAPEAKTWGFKPLSCWDGWREEDVDLILALMRHKQERHESTTESRDAKQRRLNDVVNRGLEQMRDHANA